VSWDIENWPPDVYPHKPSRARYVVRAHQNELILAGALTRVGRELVILATGYGRWLQERAYQAADPSTLGGAALAARKARQQQGGGAT
jgi:hypothetical protein